MQICGLRLESELIYTLYRAALMAETPFKKMNLAKVN